MGEGFAVGPGNESSKSLKAETTALDIVTFPIQAPVREMVPGQRMVAYVFIVFGIWFTMSSRAVAVAGDCRLVALNLERAPSCIVFFK